jgi:O-methyltransferase involved in polyketide biosynthesis
VAVDLRDDWPSVLRANGFYETRPTTRSAGGLLAYLPPDAQDRLFDEITAMSVPGSRLATEYHPHDSAFIAERNKLMASVGEPRAGPRQSTLMYHRERNPAADYLRAVLAAQDPDSHKTVPAYGRKMLMASRCAPTGVAPRWAQGYVLPANLTLLIRQLDRLACPRTQ